MSNNVQYTLSLNDLLSQQLKNANAAANNLEGTIGGLQSSLGRLAGGLGIAFGIGQVKNFAMSVVEAGSKVENATTGLTTLLKDSGAAAQVVKDTMVDATKTPFAFEGLLQANKALISANVSASDARGTVLDLANAIAATGGGDDELSRMVVNLQQVKNVGKATAADIKQFAFAGINIYEVLAKATGKTADETKDMTVSYDLLTSALKKARAEGGIYANGLENMAGNTSVQISNIGDAFFQLKVMMFNDLKPAIDVIIRGFLDMVGTLTDLWQWGVKNASTLKLVAELVMVGVAAWGAYKLALMGVALWSKITVAWEAIQYASITLLGDGMLVASGFTTLMAGAQVMLNAAFAANPIGFVITAIAALVAIVVLCWNKFEGFRAFMFAAWAVIKVIVGQIIEYFESMYHVIKGVFTFDLDEMKKGGAMAADVMFNTGKKIAEAAKEGWKEGVADFAKDNPTGGAAVNTPKDISKKGGAAGVVTPTPDTGKSKLPSQSASKSVTINVQIGTLIKEFSINTTNVKDSAGQMKGMVVQTLLSAVNDSQITAGQ